MWLTHSFLLIHKLYLSAPNRRFFDDQAHTWQCYHSCIPNPDLHKVGGLVSLCNSGVWGGVDPRMDTKKTCVLWRLDTCSKCVNYCRLNSGHNIGGSLTSFNLLHPPLTSKCDWATQSSSSTNYILVFRTAVSLIKRTVTWQRYHNCIPNPDLHSFRNSGVWGGVDLRMDTKKTCVLWRLDTCSKCVNYCRLNSRHNIGESLWLLDKLKNLHCIPQRLIWGRRNIVITDMIWN